MPGLSEPEQGYVGKARKWKFCVLKFVSYNNPALVIPQPTSTDSLSAPVTLIVFMLVGLSLGIADVSPRD